MIRGEVDTVIRPRIWQPETWNLWFYLQEGEKSQGREGGGGCFSGPCLFVADSAPKTCRSFSPLCPLPTLSDIRSNKQTLQTTHFIWWHLFNVWTNDPAGNISYLNFSKLFKCMHSRWWWWFWWQMAAVTEWVTKLLNWFISCPPNFHLT